MAAGKKTNTIKGNQMNAPSSVIYQCGSFVHRVTFPKHKNIGQINRYANGDIINIMRNIQKEAPYTS